jgi:hypothetical protein
LSAAASHSRPIDVVVLAPRRKFAGAAGGCESDVLVGVAVGAGVPSGGRVGVAVGVGVFWDASLL